MSEKEKNHPIGAVMVVGGGIGGMQAALDLVGSGYFVYLVDNSPAIGGVMAQLDKTFPTNDCSMCIMSPKLVECGRHLNIKVITNAELQSVEGEPGHFSVTLNRKPRYIRSDRCTGCGECAKHCPVTAIDTYNEKLSQRSAIYIQYPQAIPKVYLIDREQCIGCGLCERVCLARAVDYSDKQQVEKIEVGSVILATGYEMFDARLRPEFGYGVFPNVVTSIEFERLLSATGPHRGHLLRPSDGTIPEKVAFIQCVGSRDSNCGNGYCSSVCCMYATKEAIIAKEHVHFVKPTIFFMDIRAYGKGFDAYYESAKSKYGIRFIRCMVSKIRESLKTNNLLVTYMNDEGKLVEEEFELVVLSVGMVPSQETVEMAKRIGVELESHGFCKTTTFEPTSTTRKGIYVCGAFQEPKDIPETVAQASAAAAEASSLLAEARGTMVAEKKYVPEINVNYEGPRVGAFICHCGINIGGIVDVPAVVEYARTLPYVVYAEANLYTCSQDTQDHIKKVIEENRLNRVVVASCTPRTHEPLFQDTIREAGLNRYLFEMTNIRDQCSWVHKQQPKEATEKSKDLVRMAVAKAALLEPLQTQMIGVVQKAMVIGGGLSGMTAANKIAEAGYEVYLIERESQLGGKARAIHFTLEGDDVQSHLKQLAEKVEKNPRIHLMTQTEIESVNGFVGNFKTKLRRGKELQEIDHGVIVVASGAEEYRPKEFLYGQDSRVITQKDLEEKIFLHPSDLKSLKNVVMIQCVGSRNSERPYCSRMCCSEAVKNALKLKEMSPGTNVYILYRDMRTYGFKEDYYRKAREAGVIFVRFEPEREPRVEKEGKALKVSVQEPILQDALNIETDLLVLSAGIIPSPDNERLSKMLKVPLNQDGYFLEAHMKLRPVDFATEGIFLAGLAHNPKSIEESLSQANAAVSRALTYLSKKELETIGTISEVDERKCIGCGLCEEVCPYKAIEIVVKRTVVGEKQVAQVNRVLCKGCGACTASCRSGSIDLKGFTNSEVVSQIMELAVNW